MSRRSKYANNLYLSTSKKRKTLEFDPYIQDPSTGEENMVMAPFILKTIQGASLSMKETGLVIK